MEVKGLISKFTQIRSLPQRRKEGQKLAKSLSTEELKALIVGLVEKEDSKTAWDLIAHLITSTLFAKYPDFVISLIKKLACHQDWEIREEAATVIKRLKERYFDDLYPVMERWVKEDNPFLLRAVSVGMIKPFKGEEEKLDKILELFEKIVQCDDAYVKKNCGPFGLAAVFRRYPDKVEQKLYEWMEKYPNNPVVIWNIMAVFSQANAKYFPDYGKRVLDRVEQKGFLEKFPQLQRSWEGVKKKVGFS